ncbi:MAG: hypothetical protein POH28_15185 [Acidocella sp.]|nr:hypothetical protein [Acidocella sp.]
MRTNYHVAKLALFNIRLLNVIQNNQSNEIVELIKSECERNGFSSPPSLLHQGAFLAHAYICVVWLWESVKKARLAQDFLSEFPKTASRFNLSLPPKEKIYGPRNLENWEQVLRLIRNALSHGKVEIDDNYYLLSDQKQSGRFKETEKTCLKLTWEDFGKLSEVCIHALTPTLYPNHSAYAS